MAMTLLMPGKPWDVGNADAIGLVVPGRCQE
ncbi:hypothetical protein FHS94_000392 [Sphingomonas aerophila]|uniref:Uncharacterized protein n=1 Tax=Sphingomonas aerophila TaxID=1344948 RepID=A0A7W9EUK8_9SPHN|nr:hypothetical protein [Sphingomonas aerophila]